MPNRRVITVLNEAECGPAWFAEWLAVCGITLDLIHAYDGAPVPDRVRADGLIVLGGAPGADEDDRAPWLPAVRSLLASAVEDAVPTLGICLGHQLLAVACGGTGGRAVRSPEVGVFEVSKLPAAEGDPVFGGLPESFLVNQGHQDEVYALPPGAVRLAASPACDIQGFRIGERAWGVQGHPEVVVPRQDWWTTSDDDLLATVGRSAEELTVEAEAASARLIATWRPFAERFAGVVHAHGSQRRSRAASVGTWSGRSEVPASRQVADSPEPVSPIHSAL